MIACLRGTAPSCFGFAVTMPTDAPPKVPGTRTSRPRRRATSTCPPCRGRTGSVAFYNQRGTAEQHIKDGKNAVTWTRLSCYRFAANAVRLQLHALAYKLANFLRTLALHDDAKQWSLTTLRERLVKIGARVVRHGRSVIFQMAEVAVPRPLFRQVLAAIAALRPLPPPAQS